MKIITVSLIGFSEKNDITPLQNKLDYVVKQLFLSKQLSLNKLFHFWFYTIFEPSCKLLLELQTSFWNIWG